MSDDIFWTPKREENDVPDYPTVVDQSPAVLWKEQVDRYHSLQQGAPYRSRIKFSPSGATKCCRELYYTNTNAPQDTEELSPWKRRMSNNGTAYHEGIQNNLGEMQKRMAAGDIPSYFRVIQWELKGSKTVKVNLDGAWYDVEVDGRCDGMLEFIGTCEVPGLKTGDVVMLEFKSKDKLTNLKKIARFGIQDEHRKQVVCYSIIWGHNKAFLHYESLQKPKWSDPPESIDWCAWYMEVNEFEQKAVLRRFASVVKAIQEGILPAPELSKCAFCPFHTQCAKDGGFVPPKEVAADA